MVKLEILTGINSEVVTITESQFKILQDYGKCLTDEIFSIKTSDNQSIPSNQVDDYKILA